MKFSWPTVMLKTQQFWPKSLEGLLMLAGFVRNCDTFSSSAVYPFQGFAKSGEGCGIQKEWERQIPDESGVL